MQLHKSKKLVLFLISIFFCSIIGLMLSANMILKFAFFVSGYFLIFLISIAAGTALHESSHFSILYELGFSVDNIIVHRIGNVSFRIIDMDQLTSEQLYQVAKAPFVRKGQYILDLSLSLILVSITLLSPYPLNIFLGFFTCLIALSIVASVCAYIVIRRKKHSGLIVKIARTTSRGDIVEIVEWNRNQSE